MELGKIVLLSRSSICRGVQLTGRSTYPGYCLSGVDCALYYKKKKFIKANSLFNKINFFFFIYRRKIITNSGGCVLLPIGSRHRGGLYHRHEASFAVSAHA